MSSRARVCYLKLPLHTFSHKAFTLGCCRREPIWCSGYTGCGQGTPEALTWKTNVSGPDAIFSAGFSCKDRAREDTGNPYSRVSQTAASRDFPGASWVAHPAIYSLATFSVSVTLNAFRALGDLLKSNGSLESWILYLPRQILKSVVTILHIDRKCPNTAEDGTLSWKPRSYCYCHYDCYFPHTPILP